jgi:hypothetical protein
VGPIPPLHRLRLEEPQVHLMHQRHWLQRVVQPLLSQKVAGDTPQFVVDGLDNLLSSTLVSFAPAAKQRSQALFGARRECNDSVLDGLR